MDAAQLTGALALAITIVGVLWRVGSVGKTVGEKMAQLASEVAGLASRVGHLETAKATAEAKHLEALEAEVAELRSAHPSHPPRPVPRPRPTGGAKRAT